MASDNDLCDIKGGKRVDICSINTRPLSSLYYADAHPRAHTHARTRADSKQARWRAFGRRKEKTFAQGKRAILTGLAGVFVVYGLCSLLFIIVVVRLFVVETVTNCHFAPESQAGKHQRDPAHLSGQCRGRSVHLKIEFEWGPRCSAGGRWSNQSARENSRRCANSADHCDGSLSSLWFSGSYSASFMAGAHRAESGLSAWASVSEATAECAVLRRAGETAVGQAGEERRGEGISTG